MKCKVELKELSELWLSDEYKSVMRLKRALVNGGFATINANALCQRIGVIDEFHLVADENLKEFCRELYSLYVHVIQDFDSEYFFHMVDNMRLEFLSGEILCETA